MPGGVNAFSVSFLTASEGEERGKSLSEGRDRFCKKRKFSFSQENFYFCENRQEGGGGSVRKGVGKKKKGGKILLGKTRGELLNSCGI